MGKIEFIIYGRPASKKNSKQLIHVHGRPMFIPSKAYQEFEKDALKQLLVVRGIVKKPIAYPITMSVTLMQKGHLTQDYDNALGAIGDVLQKAGIISDDKLIKHGSWDVEGEYDEWKTKIQLEW